MKKIIFLSFTVLLAGCATKAPTYVPVPPVAPNLAPIDSKLMEDCKPLTKLPQKDLSQIEVERYWSLDRKNFAECRDKQHALGDTVKFRDDALSNTNKKNKN